MKDMFVTVVCVIDNDSKIIGERVSSIHKELESNYSDFEIILIDQCSNSITTNKLNCLLRELTSIRHIRLSQKVKYDVALAAGVENAIGDYIVIMSIKSDPENCIVNLVEQCADGVGIVIGVCAKANSMGYRLFEPFLNKILEKFAYKSPKGATNLRCLSRQVVNAVTESGRYHHKFFARIANSGFSSGIYNYSLLSNSGIEPKGLIKGIKETFREVVFNSTSPLRWMSGLGLFASVLAFLFSAYSILTNLIRGDVAEGWTTLVFFTSSLFMLHFIIMAFFGEYLGRLLDDRTEQRDYSVLYEKHSSVMVNENRVNVLVE